jgi:hypothetical protein
MKCYFTYILLLQRFLSEQMETSAGTVNDKSSPARLSPSFLQTLHSSFPVLPVVLKSLLQLLTEPSFIHNVHLNYYNLFPSLLSLWWFVLWRGIPFVMKSSVYRGGFISDHRNWFVVTFLLKSSFHCLKMCLYILQVVESHGDKNIFIRALSFSDDLMGLCGWMHDLSYCCVAFSDTV